MDNSACFGNEQASGIKSGIPIVFALVLHHSGCPDQVFASECQQSPEVEVIAYTSRLVINGGMLFLFFLFPLVMVGIDHAGLPVLQEVGYAFQSHVA